MNLCILMFLVAPIPKSGEMQGFLAMLFITGEDDCEVDSLIGLFLYGRFSNFSSAASAALSTFVALQNEISLVSSYSVI